MTSWPSSRSPVLTTGNMVCSASPLAASAGLEVLEQGGNAFDAAIAAGAVEAVTLPGKCSIGGEAFAIIYQASTGRAFGLNSSGPAPLAATPALYRSKGYTSIPARGPLAVSPPGEVAAYQLIVDTAGMTDAASAQQAGGQIAAGVIGLARRYSHSAVEMFDVTDVQAIIDLVCLTAAALTGRDQLLRI